MLNIYRSVDGAASWEDLSAQFLTSPLDAVRRNPHLLKLRQDTIIVANSMLTTSNGLWLSTDAGVTWKPGGAGLAGVTVADIYAQSPRQRGHWLGIGAGGIWKTANAGSQWRGLAAGLPAASRLNDLVSSVDDADTLLMLSGGVSPFPAAYRPCGAVRMAGSHGNRR